jgi:hypothetical protein
MPRILKCVSMSELLSPVNWHWTLYRCPATSLRIHGRVISCFTTAGVWETMTVDWTSAQSYNTGVTDYRRIIRTPLIGAENTALIAENEPQ